MGNNALQDYKAAMVDDQVVHIQEATKNDGEYTTPYPIGYDVFDNVMKGGAREGDLTIITGLSGSGKCLAKNTSILMFNGSKKMVQNIVVGDKLMGDDSKPRNVLSLANGTEEMFDIIPTKGEKYTVNRSHVLSLKNNHQDAYGGKGIKDISVDEYLKQGLWWKQFHVGYKVGVDFSNKKLPIDPYYIGLWLGDGHSDSSRITTMDNEIVEWLEKYSNSINHSLKKFSQKNNRSSIYSITRDKFVGGASKEETVKNGKIYSYENRRGKNAIGFGSIKSIQSIMKDLNIIGNKHIPKIYKCNSRNVRLKVLAGLIDSDGYTNNNCYEICLKDTKLVDDVIYLVRSLGIGCHLQKSKFVDGKKYPRISIYGELSDVPVLLKRKKCHPRKQVKNPLHYGIKIQSVGEGKYYGFEIDGNKRFLLGDFTVTHNTTLAQNISVNYSKRKQPCLWFSYEVIVDNLYAKFKDMGATDKNFFIYTPKQTTSGGIDWIEKKIVEGLEKENTKFIFIDHIDFLSPRNVKGSDQRRIMLRDICQELKRIAIDHKVAIFLIAHVKKVQGREVEMQDIAESSGIYQLADFVFAVTRKFDIKEDNTVNSKRKVEMVSDQSEIRMLKNRLTGEQPSMNFILKDNIIRPLSDDGILSLPEPLDDGEEEVSFEELNKLF